MNRTILWGLIAVAGGLVYAQSDPRLARPFGPTLGFAFDRAASALRPILGIPGAARFGAPIDVGFPISLAAVSPKQNFTIAINSTDSQVYLIRFSANGAVAQLLDGAVGAPAMLVLSPRGASAVLVDGSRTTLQVVTGLPESPAVGQAMRPGTGRGQIESVGVGDDGAVLASVSSDNTSSLYLVPATSIPQLVGAALQVSAIAFLPGTWDALVADRGNNQVLLFRNRAGGTTLTAIGTAADGIADPAGVASSRNGRFVFVANAGSRSLVRLDLTGATATASFPCRCDPGGLSRLAGDSVFQLTELSSQLAWVFDGDAANPRIVFIPAPAVEADGK